MPQSKMREDGGGTVFQTPDLSAAPVNHTVSVSTASAATATVIVKSLVQVTSTVAGFIKHGAAATTGDTYVPAGVPMYFSVAPNAQKLSFIGTGSGTLYITEF